MDKSAPDAAYNKLKQIVLPGWAVPAECNSVFKALSNETEIIDYGFFSGYGKSLDFNDFEIAPKRDCFVTGHSLGSLLALKSALKTDKIKALVLIAPFARFTESENYPGQPELAVATMKRQLNKNPGGLLKSFYRRMGFSPALPEEFNIEALNAGLDALAELDFREMPTKIKIPTIIICGDNDLIVKEETSKDLAGRLESFELHTIPGAGHAAPFTHTNECLELIAKFLKKHL